MTTENDDSESCPYCDRPNPTLTDDHIFPQFLGGHRTIRVCRECNNTFGHTFEGATARRLKQQQVFISHFGLDLTTVPGLWPSALTIGDITYDLISGPDGAQYVLNKPAFRRDAEGHISGGTARSVSEANRIAQGLIEAGLAKEIEISETPYEQFDDVSLTVPISVSPELYRVATKLVAAVLVDSGFKKFVTDSGIGAYLCGKREWNTTPAYCDITKIIKLGPPLAHIVYVELGATSYGIASMFGNLSVFVPLPPASVNRAYLATLDPIVGEEKFSQLDPIGARGVPATIDLAGMRFYLNEMNRMLMEAANLRGAKHPPKLTIPELDPGPPQFYLRADSTLRYILPLNRSRGKEG